MSFNNNDNNLNFKTLPLSNNQKLNVSSIPKEIALFIDNDAGYIKDVKKCGLFMDVLKVGGMAGHVPDIPWEESTLQPFIKAVSQTEEGKEILEKWKVVFQDGAPYDPESGITEDDSKYVQKWVLQKKKQGYRTISVLFDYDRTLTVVEGTDLSKLEDSTIQGFVEYHLGGKDRFLMLKDLFRSLSDQGVYFYVLTNNGQCADARYSGRFKKVVDYIFNPYPVTIICGQEWHGHKHEAAAAILPSVCRSRVEPLKYVKNNSRVIYRNNGLNNNENTSEAAINRQLDQLQGGKHKRSSHSGKTQKRKRKIRKTRKH